MFRVWNPSIWPGLAIALCVWAFNMVGDGLRDVLRDAYWEALS